MTSPHARVAYSQEGEDLLLLRMLEGRSAGFYVDVGAHHPDRFSNTRLLYELGWQGLNIDATPGSMEVFRRGRPRDINIEALISSRAGAHQFHRFNDPALNSASAELARDRERQTEYHVTSIETLSARRLDDVLSEHLPDGVESIDLMSVDVEGHDLDVLESNDWSRFRPTLLLVEVLDTTLAELGTSGVVSFLADVGYSPVAKLMNTVVLKDDTHDTGAVAR